MKLSLTVSTLLAAALVPRLMAEGNLRALRQEDKADKKEPKGFIAKIDPEDGECGASFYADTKEKEVFIVLECPVEGDASAWRALAAEAGGGGRSG